MSKSEREKERENYLRIVEYTSHRIPPVQYINMSVFFLSTFAKGSEATSWKIRNKAK
jgi:hypothetical protein